MMSSIEVENISIRVERKCIKNIYIRVYPPLGDVRISAPKRMDLEAIRGFAISRIKWIRNAQERFRNLDCVAPSDYVTHDVHYFCGKQFFLKVVERHANPAVALRENEILLFVRPETTTEKRKALLDGWYRMELRRLIAKSIEYWEQIIGVKINEFGIKRMKTKWGTCNVRAKRIWLNLELVKRAPECLDYVIVHELVHLLEPSHNMKFKNYMTQFMPAWKHHRAELNKLPICTL